MEATRVPPRGRATRPTPDDASSRRRPVAYTLTKPAESLPGAATTPSDLDASSPNYGMLVLGTAQASLTLFVTQAAVSILLANALGSGATLRFAYGVIPHVAIAATSQSIVSLSTWPPAIAASTVGAGALWNLWRRRDNPMFVLGWATGLFMAAELLLIQIGRHIAHPPFVDPWIIGQSFAFVGAATLIFVAFRPTWNLQDRAAYVPTKPSESRSSEGQAVKENPS